MNSDIMCIKITTATQVKGTVVCGISVPMIFFSTCSPASISQAEIVSTIFVKNVDKIFCCLAFILDSRCEYDLRTRALLSRHICWRYDVARPTPRGDERLDFIEEKNIKNEIINTHLFIISKQYQTLIIHVNLEL